MKKKWFLCLVGCALATGLKCQVPDSTALIVIDIQDFYFPGGSIPLFHPEIAAQNAAELIHYFRKEGKTVVHVGHLAKSGTAFHDSVKPLPGEKVFMKKKVNAFQDTDLDAFLRHMGIKTLVICGMQTHMCVEGAVREAADLGYRCIIAGDACATRDVDFGGHSVSATDVHFSTLATLQNYGWVTDVKKILGE
jgi:nicotinamidase-related amidase